MSNKKRESISVEQLNEMQRYLGEETIEDYQAGLMNRRRMLRRLVLICGGSGAIALLAACGDTTSTASSTTGAAATTQAATTAANSTAAATTATSTTQAVTTAAATTASNATTASATTAPTSTTAATGTTAAAGAPPAPTPGAARGPLTVPEDDPAVDTSSVSIPPVGGSGTTVMGYVARPKASGTYPGVIVIHENRGLTDHIKDVARRLAKAGYIALAPDLASGAGGTAKLPSDNVTGYFANAKPEDLVAELNTTLSGLENQPGFKKDKYGVVGFCFGGGYTLRFVAANPKLVAAVSYYGPVPQPVSQMSATNAAILGQYGALDTRVNAGIPDLEKTLTSSGKTFVKKIYDGANHAFNNDTGASYNETAAVAAWKETLGWFDKYLKA